jgi:hypothetical protein
VSTLRQEDLEIKLHVLSAKNYAELSTKAFAKNYQNVIQVYQNEMGFLDRFQKLLKCNPEHRVFIQYNEIVSTNEDKSKVTLKNVITPIPINFKVNSNISRLLQRAFNVIKYITLQRIYSNSYSKHCVTRIPVQEGEKNENEATRINMCVIMLEHSNDLNNNSVNHVFFQNLINNFKTKLGYIENPRKQKTGSDEAEEYFINVNYGVTSLDSNKGLNKLYKGYLEAKNIQVPKEKSKLFLIINDTQEKFNFRWFKDEEALKEFLSDIDKSEYFEDGQFGVKFITYLLINSYFYFF